MSSVVITDRSLQPQLASMLQQEGDTSYGRRASGSFAPVAEAGSSRTSAYPESALGLDEERASVLSFFCTTT